MATAPNYSICGFSSGAAPLQAWAKMFEFQMNMATVWFDAALRMNPFFPAVDTTEYAKPHPAPAPAPKAKPAPKPKVAAKPKAAPKAKAAPAEAAKPRPARAKSAPATTAKSTAGRRRAPAKPAQPFKTED